jgi:hypothetical protein
MSLELQLELQDICYISLGSDCSVSYQLRLLGLQQQKYGSMPFDWMRIDNLQSVISILDAKFDEFTKFRSYNVKPQSETFEYLDAVGCDNIKSLCRMIHKTYKFILPHEYQGTYIEPVKFQDKYARRISRFLEIGRNPALRKVFVRLGTTKEKELIKELHISLDKLGIVNYEVKYIILEEWDGLISNNETFKWQRDYIPWKTLISNN